jgi:hypothetical protein
MFVAKAQHQCANAETHLAESFDAFILEVVGEHLLSVLRALSILCRCCQRDNMQGVTKFSVQIRQPLLCCAALYNMLKFGHGFKPPQLQCVRKLQLSE